MENTPISFDQLPAYVFALGRKVDDLTDLLRSQADRTNPSIDRWLSVEELVKYLPDKPAISTVYGKVQRREIPFVRKGKRLAFRQSDIDSWLQSGRVKTASEISDLANQHSSSKPQRRGGGR